MRKFFPILAFRSLSKEVSTVCSAQFWDWPLPAHKSMAASELHLCISGQLKHLQGRTTVFQHVRNNWLLVCFLCLLGLFVCLFLSSISGEYENRMGRAGHKKKAFSYRTELIPIEQLVWRVYMRTIGIVSGILLTPTKRLVKKKTQHAFKKLSFRNWDELHREA